MSTSIVDLLRHGEAQGGARFRGRTDDPLTALGWRQMLAQTADQQWDAIISSPLKRCREFSSHLCQQQNMPLKIEDSWQEINFGDWDGKTAAQIIAEDPLAFEQYYSDPSRHAPPNGERHEEFIRRVENAWRTVLSDYPGQHILVVTHAGVIRTLFSRLLGLSFRQSFQIEIGHASLSRFKCYCEDTEPYIQLNFHKPI